MQKGCSYRLLLMLLVYWNVGFAVNADVRNFVISSIILTKPQSFRQPAAIDFNAIKTFSEIEGKRYISIDVRIRQGNVSGKFGFALFGESETYALSLAVKVKDHANRRTGLEGIIRARASEHQLQQLEKFVLKGSHQQVCRKNVIVKVHLARVIGSMKDKPMRKLICLSQKQWTHSIVKEFYYNIKPSFYLQTINQFKSTMLTQLRLSLSNRVEGYTVDGKSSVLNVIDSQTILLLAKPGLIGKIHHFSDNKIDKHWMFKVAVNPKQLRSGSSDVFVLYKNAPLIKSTKNGILISFWIPVDSETSKYIYEIRGLSDRHGRVVYMMLFRTQRLF